MRSGKYQALANVDVASADGFGLGVTKPGMLPGEREVSE